MKRQRRQQSNFFHQFVAGFGVQFVAYLKAKIRRAVYIVAHDVFSGLETVLESYGELVLPHTRGSHPVSEWLRPAFQYKHIKAIFGANLAGAMILVGSVSADPGAIEAYPEPEMTVIAENQVVVTTESRFRRPVDTIGMSQGFSRFHRGVDLRASVGTPVYAIDEGKVIEVVYGRWGYGRYVLVEHKDGFSSLYAHLGMIEVHAGDEVTTESKLGTVGLTGWTTGAHLHLEVYEQGVAVNPITVVPLK